MHDRADEAALAVQGGVVDASCAGVRAAFLAWFGAAFSLPIVSFAVSPWPEMTGALCATAAAFAVLRQPRTRRALVAAGSLLALMVATKTRLFLLAVPLMAGFMRRARWRALAGFALVAGAAFTAMTVYDALIYRGPVTRQWHEGGIPATIRWLLTWTLQAPTEYRGHLGLLFATRSSAPF